VITGGGGSGSLYVGQSATFQVFATGSNLTYQWQEQPAGGGVWSNINGATSSSYTTPPTTINDNGESLRCVVSNPYGSATSAVFVVHVNGSSGNPPVITGGGGSGPVQVGQSATFQVSATGSNLTYQWQEQSPNGGAWSPISGATSASYTTPPTTINDNGESLRCVVSNPYGSATSAVFVVHVTGNPPVITGGGGSGSLYVGQTATFKVFATGVSLSYQWQEQPPNGGAWNPINGATSASYTTPPTTLSDNGESLRCVVSNPYGSATSAVFVVHVN
jgi:hypothetical protein